MPPKKKLSQDDAAELCAAGMTTPAPVSMRILRDEASFSEAIDALAVLDAAFMATMRAAGDLPRLRRRDPGFRGLAAIIVSQQVSTASANAIFARLEAAFPDLCAEAIHASSDDLLRQCGLSAGKARTLRAIASAELDGSLDFATLATMEAEHAHARLCAIKGIGPWTADIFLLFCLGHADAWPTGDLAVQEGVRLALDLPVRPDAKALHGLGERWRPLRGVVAHCLWAYYGHKRGRAGTLAPTATAPSRAAPPAQGAIMSSKVANGKAGGRRHP